VAIAVLVVMMPVLLVAFLGIGFFDAWFDFRRRIVLGIDDSLGAGDGA
jgi:Tfp pilus assembly protein PilX